MIFYIKIITVNHHTNLKRLTYKGTIACVKRSFEKVKIKITFITDRLTNPYKLKVELKKFLNLMRRILYYIIYKMQDQFKQPITKSKIMSGNPNINKRQNILKFGISWGTKTMRRRRTRSTIQNRKGSSLAFLNEYSFKNRYFSKEFIKLKFKAKNTFKCRNIINILSDINFLIFIWTKLKYFYYRSNLTVNHLTLNGVEWQWFLKISNSIKDENFKFNSKECRLNKDSTTGILEQTLLQQGISLLLNIVFQFNLHEHTHYFNYNKSQFTFLNQIKMQYADTVKNIKFNLKKKNYNYTHLNTFNKIIKKYIYDLNFIKLINMHLKNIKQTKPYMFYNIVINFLDNWVINFILYKYIQIKIDKPIPKISQFNKKKLFLFSNKKAVIFLYTRYKSFILIGLSNKNKASQVLKSKLKFIVNQQYNLKLTNQLVRYSFNVLNYKIKLIHKKYQLPKYVYKKLLMYFSTSIELNIPKNLLIDNLIKTGYISNKTKASTRNKKLIRNTFPNLLNHYKKVMNIFFQYYYLSNNYLYLKKNIFFLLEYSYALTLTSKLKLKTLKKIFSKHRRNLLIESYNKNITTYYYTSIKYQYFKCILNFTKNKLIIKKIF